MGWWSALTSAAPLLSVVDADPPAGELALLDASPSVYTVPDTIPSDWNFSQLWSRANETLGMTIPAMRKAMHIIAGTVSTWRFSLWNDDTGARIPIAGDNRWLDQPERESTRSALLHKTVTDLVWRDRSLWEITDRYVETGLPAEWRHVYHGRISYLFEQNDPTRVATIIVDGREVNRDDYMLIDGGGIGGIRRFGFEVIDLYLKLQTAAYNYADAPAPKTILKNTGSLQLTAAEIDILITKWMEERNRRSVGYTEALDVVSVGWSAKELQLVESREYQAVEIARMVGLPARSLDAQAGDGMTYANLITARIDVVDSIRPWFTPIEQTLSMTRRYRGQRAGLYLPRAQRASLDTNVFAWADPLTRMQIWEAARNSGALTEAEIRALEPLASETEEN